MSRIDIDFAQARKQASEIEEIARTLRKYSEKDIEEIMSQIASAWQGENARKYLKKAELLKLDVKKTATGLFDIAQRIRTAAQKIYEAEKEAERIAKERTFK